MPDGFATDIMARQAGSSTDALARLEPEAHRSVTLVYVLSLLLRYRILIAVLAAAFMLLAIGVGLLSSRTWTSTASFMPQSRRSSGGNLAGLAAQFGVAVPTGDAAESPAFYADLVHSRQILGIVSQGVYHTGPRAADTISLDRLLKVKESSPALRTAETIKRLGQRTGATAVAKTGVVNLSVRTPSPLVSQQIASRLIEELNRFNLQTRQSQAAAERKFTEQRLGEMRDSLRQSENQLLGFLQGNRAVSSSPQLQFAQDRMRREVSERQELYNTLAQAYEQAKIEEVRDTPVITVVEPPNVPARPDSRGLVSRGLLAALTGAMLGVLLAFLRDAIRSGRESGDEAYEELSELARRTLADLRHPLQGSRRRS